jgi:hypothetical protein
MDSAMTEESDGMDDADFHEQHERYLSSATIRTKSVLVSEDLRQQVPPSSGGLM